MSKNECEFANEYSKSDYRFRPTTSESRSG